MYINHGMLKKILRFMLAAIFFTFFVSFLPSFLPQSEVANAAPRTVTPRGELSSEEKATIALFEKSRDSVVFITTRAQVMDFWSRDIFSVKRGAGSGFIWDESGHVITNNHVIADASEAIVRLSNGKDYPASLVGTSPSHDIAVLRIDIDSKLSPPLPIGASSDLKVGQKVYAIGNPFGLDWTLTNGIVSALDRSLTEENQVTVEHLIQTNTAINPGNSGGPLLDSAGRLIGINTAIYSPSGASAGIGFAVPVDTVNRVVPQLISKGKYTRPALGIGIDENINRRITGILGIEGVVVLKVTPGSSAAAAGLSGIEIDRSGRIIPGDIVTAVENIPVDSVSKLIARLDNFRVGQKIRLSVNRHGKTREVVVALQAGLE